MHLIRLGGKKRKKAQFFKLTNEVVITEVVVTVPSLPTDFQRWLLFILSCNYEKISHNCEIFSHNYEMLVADFLLIEWMQNTCVDFFLST